MGGLFDDEFINRRIFKRLVKEVKDAQVSKTIEHIDQYSKLRDEFGEKYDISFVMNKNDKL